LIKHANKQHTETKVKTKLPRYSSRTKCQSFFAITCQLVHHLSIENISPRQPDNSF